METRQLLTAMAATLSAELKGAVPMDLVSDIVRAVLDERMQAARGRELDPPILEARRRLDRLIRARSTTRTWAENHAPRCELRRESLSILRVEGIETGCLATRDERRDSRLLLPGCQRGPRDLMSEAPS